MKTLNDGNSRSRKPAFFILAAVIVALTIILLAARSIEQSQSAPDVDSQTAFVQSVATQPPTINNDGVKKTGAMPSQAARSAGNAPPPVKDSRIQMLQDVHVTPNAAGAYDIESMTIDTVFDRLGLRPGDVVYSLDQLVDLQTQQAAHHFRQPDVKLDVYREGEPTVLEAHLED